MPEDLVLVGRIARTHGIRGDLLVNPETDFPDERFVEGRVLQLEMPGRSEPVTIASVRFHQGRPLVTFAGVDTMDAAESLAGLELRIPAERLAPLPAGTFYHHDLVGCRVETGSGAPVGVVSGVEGTLSVRESRRRPSSR